MKMWMVRERGFAFWQIGKRGTRAHFVGAALYLRPNRNPLLTVQRATDVHWDGKRCRSVWMFHLHSWQKLIVRGAPKGEA